MAPSLRAGVWYDTQASQPVGLAGFINDRSSRMIGYATMRQIRVKKGEFISKKNLRTLVFIVLISLCYRFMHSEQNYRQSIYFLSRRIQFSQ